MRANGLDGRPSITLHSSVQRWANKAGWEASNAEGLPSPWRDNLLAKSHESWKLKSLKVVESLLRSSRSRRKSNEMLEINTKFRRMFETPQKRRKMRRKKKTKKEIFKAFPPSQLSRSCLSAKILQTHTHASPWHWKTFRIVDIFRRGKAFSEMPKSVCAADACGVSGVACFGVRATGKRRLSMCCGGGPRRPKKKWKEHCTQHTKKPTFSFPSVRRHSSLFFGCSGPTFCGLG